ncbi:MAG: DUF4400 domain-containing protein [Rhodoferax sp.]|nr:DUF4400 domain-containing protein [Rhodoferax sp.]
MKNSSHLGFWMAFAFLLFFASPLLIGGSKMEAYVSDEVAQTRVALGDRVGDFVVSFANGVFVSTPLGVLSKTAQAAKHSKQDIALAKNVAGPGGQLMSSIYNNYLQGLVMQTYVVTMRFAIVLIWLVVLAPMLGASVYDGFMQRRIKRAEFGAIRPATFTVAGLVVIPLLALPLVYLVMPFTLSPLLAPLWALIVAFPLSVLVSNMQPLFGR